MARDAGWNRDACDRAILDLKQILTEMYDEFEGGPLPSPPNTLHRDFDGAVARLQEAAFAVAEAAERCGVDSTPALRLAQDLRVCREWVDQMERYWNKWTLPGTGDVELLLTRLMLRRIPTNGRPAAARREASAKVEERRLAVLQALPSAKNAPLKSVTELQGKLTRAGQGAWSRRTVNRDLQELRSVGLAAGLRRTPKGDQQTRE